MLQHRVVLYTDDMEPITVLQLPELARRYLLERAYVVLDVMEEVPVLERWEERPARLQCRTVTIYAELLLRKGQMHHMLFTRDEESALLLKAAFLPGQQATLGNIEARGFADGFLAALERLGMG